MKTIVGVKFKKTNKTYFFSPQDLQLEPGMGVIVETARGMEYGDVMLGNCEMEEDKIIAPLKNVLRVATPEDIAQSEKNQAREKKAMAEFADKIAEHGLDMKTVDVEYSFDGSKITFYFTSEGRVDFRDLVKDLAHHFRARIELRQIGVRDEAKMLGGMGRCGCPICCKRFLPEFSPVSIKMAKEQNISLNPTKISGLCGRLMCCLGYEQKNYEDANKLLPRIHATIQTPAGSGTVVEKNPLMQTVRVKLPQGDGFEFKTFTLAALNGEEEEPAPPEEGIVDYCDWNPTPPKPTGQNGQNGQGSQNGQGQGQRRRNKNRKQQGGQKPPQTDGKPSPAPANNPAPSNGVAPPQTDGPKKRNRRRRGGRGRSGAGKENTPLSNSSKMDTI